MRQTFPRHIESLGAIFAFIDRGIAPLHVDADIRYDLHFAAEELFTNIVKYRTESTRDVEIELDCRPDRVRIALIDLDVDPFDTTHEPAVCLDRPVEERTPGGLGIFLTRKVVDDLEYHYGDRVSRTVLTKRLP